MRIILLLISSLVIACSGSDFTTVNSTSDGVGGSGGFGTDDETAGETSDTGGSGTGGGTGGTGNIGGDTGTGGTVCVPETCEEIGFRISGGKDVVACGNVTDNCGNDVHCPLECGRNLHCGTSFWDDSAEGEEMFVELQTAHFEGGLFHDKFTQPVNKNICGHECVSVPDLPCERDSGLNAVYCSEGVVPSKAGNCEEVSSSEGVYWCCDGDGIWDYMEKTDTVY